MGFEEKMVGAVKALRKSKGITSYSLSTLVYAQGFIDEHFATHNDALDDRETDEYRQMVQDMWRIVHDGLDQLRKENASMQNKLALIDMARNTET